MSATIKIIIDVKNRRIISIYPETDEANYFAEVAETLLEESQRFGDFYAKFAAAAIDRGYFPAANYDGPSGRLTLLLHD